MSDLQCPARIVLMREPQGRLAAAAAEVAAAALAAMRTCAVYCSASEASQHAAEALASRLDVRSSVRAELPSLAALEHLADLHRGETVVVVTHGGAMSALLACWGWAGRDRDVAPCEGLVLERDGDGWRQCGRVGRTFIGELPDEGRAIPTTLGDGGAGQTA